MVVVCPCGCTGGSDSWEVLEKDLKEIGYQSRKVGSQRLKDSLLLPSKGCNGSMMVLVKVQSSDHRHIAGAALVSLNF